MSLLIRIPRDLPASRTTARRLQNEVEASEGENRFKDLGGSRYALLKRELGFMETIHHVALYEENPGLLQKHRLQLITTEPFESKRLSPLKAKRKRHPSSSL